MLTLARQPCGFADSISQKKALFNQPQIFDLSQNAALTCFFNLSPKAALTCFFNLSPKTAKILVNFVHQYFN